MVNSTGISCSEETRETEAGLKNGWWKKDVTHVEPLVVWPTPRKPLLCNSSKLAQLLQKSSRVTATSHSVLLCHLSWAVLVWIMEPITHPSQRGSSITSCQCSPCVYHAVKWPQIIIKRVTLPNYLFVLNTSQLQRNNPSNPCIDILHCCFAFLNGSE